MIDALSSHPKSSNIGIIGLGVMGSNLARNFASKNYQVSIYNRTFARTQELRAKHGKNLVGFETLKEFVNSLELPRKIIIMVKNGAPTQEVVQDLLEFIHKDDIIMDCGNSNYKDTLLLQKALKNKVNFLGCGVSGGSKGALYGPSIMPSGKKEAVQIMLPYLESIAAKDFHGRPCVTNIGTESSGHFVKMVHNGIEYAAMQAIAEIYDILRFKEVNQMNIREVFSRLNKGNLQGFLLDITEDVLNAKTETGQSLLDLVDDRAQAKGTGAWAVEAGIDLGVNVQSIAAALFARYASSQERFIPEDFVVRRKQGDKDFTITEKVIDNLYKSLELSFFASYLQGLDLIDAANSEYKWNINIDEVLRIWEGGCIIRSQMISTLRVYKKLELQSQVGFLRKNAMNLESAKTINSYTNTPKPVINSSSDYFVSKVAVKLPQNLIQAQRDYFGQHTYKRTDMLGDFTGGWGQD
jgi:6-phosphogluconate dehydrogenase